MEEWSRLSIGEASLERYENACAYVCVCVCVCVVMFTVCCVVMFTNGCMNVGISGVGILCVCIRGCLLQRSLYACKLMYMHKRRETGLHL